jgi:hypothetical protein
VIGGAAVRGGRTRIANTPHCQTPGYQDAAPSASARSAAARVLGRVDGEPGQTLSSPWGNGRSSGLDRRQHAHEEHNGHDDEADDYTPSGFRF